MSVQLPTVFPAHAIPANNKQNAVRIHNRVIQLEYVSVKIAYIEDNQKHFQCDC